MGNPRLSRLVQRNIYAMKRDYGDRVDVYQIRSSETDHLTGVKTVVREVFHVRRAPILPSRIKRHVNQSISVISAGKEFVYGGFYDGSLREVILDARDLPKGFEPRPEDYIVYKSSRWDIVTAEKFEVDAGWVLTVKNIPDMKPYEIHDIVITQQVGFDYEVSTDPFALKVLNELGLSNTHSVIRTISSTPVQTSPLAFTQTVSAEVESP